MFKKSTKLFLMLFFSLLIVGIPCATVMAASNLSIYNYTTKKTTTYTGQQVNYHLNGSAMNMRKTPGIIESGTALGSYQDVFVKSGLKVKYNYDKAKGTVTLSQNGNTIVLTIGSKSAKVNGKTQTMSVAPVKIKFNKENVTKILVPTRFVAENLGYTYSWNSSTSIANITTPLNLEYSNKKVAYTGTQGQVMIDGKKISLGKMPSIIISNTAMLRAKQVFSSSSIGADYEYNSKTKELTLTKDDTVVVLTMGSKIAYVNDRARTMDAAPVVVKNLDSKTSYVMVPGSFVASYLGYDYTWNASTKTSVITERLSDDDDYQEEDQDGPELGDDNAPDKTELYWSLKEEYKSIFEKLKYISNITSISEDTTSSGNIYSVERDYSQNQGETYILRSYTPFNQTSISKENNILRLQIKNTYTNNLSQTFGGTLVDLITANYQYSDSSSLIELSLKDSHVKYEVTLSADKTTMYITVYPNYLTDVIVGTNGGSDYVELVGINPLSANIIEKDNTIILEMNTTMNGVGANYASISNLNSIKGLQATTSSNGTSVVIELHPGTTYTTTTKDNHLLLNFKKNNSNVNTDYDVFFPLPAGVNFDMVEHEDRYYNKQIAIQIPGDYRDYYNSLYLSSNNGVIRTISVTYSYGYTEIILTTSKIQGYHIESYQDGVGVRVGNPRDMYDRIIVLDAGHGGTDPGAVRKLNGVEYHEKDFNFSIITKSKDYFNSSDSTIKVYYSRYDDTKVDLYDRAAFASTVGADLFISIHMNANNNTSPKGTEIYYTSSNKSTTSSGLNSKTFADLVLKSLPAMIGTDTRYVFDRNLVVTRETKVPAILIEVGFMSNVDDLRLIKEESTHDDVAYALYIILEEIFDMYPTGR